MKKLANHFISFTLILSTGLMLTLTSCEQQPEPMKLPPENAFSIDLDQFPSKNAKSIDYTALNWTYSALTVFGWNVVIAVNMAIPVIAYAAALNNVPVYLGDNTWEWSYDVYPQQVLHHVTLLGSRIDNDNFKMEMYLSRGDSLWYDFKWFEGVVKYNHTQADWTLSFGPENPKEYLDIHYEKDFEKGTSHIRYTVTDPENDLYNAYIEYGLDSTLAMDAYYTIYKDDNTTYIEWSRDTKAGRVMDIAHFQDDLWHCWDTTLQDVECNLE